ITSGQMDVYVEYTGTAYTAMLKHAPVADRDSVYRTVARDYAQRFTLVMGSGAGRVTEIRRSAGRLVPRGRRRGRAVACRGGRAPGVFRATVAAGCGGGLGRHDRGRGIASLRK